MKPIISPSILSADFAYLAKDLEMINRSEADWVHIDIMDGCFVPTISMGVPVVASLRKRTSLFFDVHIMAQEPTHLIKEFAQAGADMITVHAEACTHLDRTLGMIHELGCKAGIAINPATPVSVLENVIELADMVLIMTVNPGFGGQKYISYCDEKIRALRAMIDEKGLPVKIEVDGGVNASNVKRLAECGVDIVVCGSAVFEGNITENMKKIMEQLA